MLNADERSVDADNLIRITSQLYFYWWHHCTWNEWTNEIDRELGVVACWLVLVLVACSAGSQWNVVPIKNPWWNVVYNGINNDVVPIGVPVCVDCPLLFGWLVLGSSVSLLKWIECDDQSKLIPGLCISVGQLCTCTQLLNSGSKGCCELCWSQVKFKVSTFSAIYWFSWLRKMQFRRFNDLLVTVGMSLRRLLFCIPFVRLAAAALCRLGSPLVLEIDLLKSKSFD